MLKKISIVGLCTILSVGSAVAKPAGGANMWGKWNDDIPPNEWSFNMTDTTARSGELSQRIELRNGDCKVRPQPRHDPNWGCYNDRERAEVKGYQWKPGKDQWIGFSIKITDEWQKTQGWNDHCTSIFQIKQTEKVYQGNLGPGYIGSHAVVHGVVCGSNFGLEIKRTGFEENKFNGWNKSEFVWFGNINNIKNKWNDIALRWNTKGYKSNKSSLEIYLNGHSAGSWKNITTNFFPEDYTFKYGLYRGFMKQHGVTTKTQVIYFDEIRYGKSFDSVNPIGKKALD